MRQNFEKNNFKFLLQYLRPYLGKLLLALLAMLVATLTTLAGPYLTKIAIDNYILAGDMAGLNLVFILMIILYAIYWLASYWQTYLSGLIGQNIVASIREDLYHHLQKLSLDFYKKRVTGDIMSRLTHDVNALSDLVSAGFIRLLNDLLTFFGIVFIMLYLNIRLALISFIVVPFILWATTILGKRLKNAYREVREKLAELNSDVEENISGIRLVQALNREAVNIGKFKKLSWKNFEANLKAVAYFALLFPTVTLSRVLGEALVLVYGGLAVINGSLTLGILVAFLGYVRRFFAPLSNLSNLYNTYQSAAAALKRIIEYLAIEPNVKEADNPVQLQGKIKGEIVFAGVNFSYDQQPVIKSLDLKIGSGEVLALVGKSGVGKTTIINLLTRLYDIDQGKILIDGIDIRKLSFKTLRKIIAVVPQDVYLFDISIKDNIRFGKANASDQEVEKVSRQVNAHNFISNLPNGYNTIVGEGGVKLSGGQRQLISFARALIADPQILILDEATSSIDPYTELLIQKALTELLKDRTAIMIAHKSITLKKADRIMTLEGGRVAKEEYIS